MIDTYVQVVGYVVIIAVSVAGVVYGAAWLLLDAIDRVHKRRPWMMWVAAKTLWMNSTLYRRGYNEPRIIVNMLRKHADDMEKSLSEENSYG